jgi:hypothetical protein
MADHEIHHRRLSRNVGTGLALGALVILLAGLSYVKLTNLPPSPPSETAQP